MRYVRLEKHKYNLLMLWILIIGISQIGIAFWLRDIRANTWLIALECTEEGSYSQGVLREKYKL